MLEDLDSIVPNDPDLKLPIGGRTYVVTECSGEAWLRLVRYGDALREQADGKKPVDGLLGDLELCRLALGSVYDEMLPHVPPSKLKIAGFTAWFWQIGNPAAAEAYWGSGGKAQTRRRSTSTSTAAASGTQRRANGSGTTSRRTSATKSKPNAKAT